MGVAIADAGTPFARNRAINESVSDLDLKTASTVIKIPYLRIIKHDIFG